MLDSVVLTSNIKSLKKKKMVRMPSPQMILDFTSKSHKYWFSDEGYEYLYKTAIATYK